jgi:phosphatidylserine/phosphatidylglycerophosphate/cardiolipin synthase-like enzyme
MIRKGLLTLCVISSLLLVTESYAGTIENTCFTPRSKCAPLIESEIGLAKHDIAVQAYSFTSAPIADALIQAHERGVKVTVILDKSQRRAKNSQIKRLLNAGIPVFIDTKVSIAHNKVIIIDNDIVITGSYNFTNNAENKNAENLLVIKGQDTALKYHGNFDIRLGQSTPVEGKAAQLTRVKQAQIAKETPEVYCAKAAATDDRIDQEFCVQMQKFSIANPTKTIKLDAA